MLIPIKRRLKHPFVLLLISMGLVVATSYLKREYLFNMMGIYYYAKGSKHFQDLDEAAFVNSIQTAEGLFLRAIQTDSSFAPAYANLGVLTMFKATEESFQRGRAFFAKAISLSPQKVEFYLLSFEHLVRFHGIMGNISLDEADRLIAISCRLSPDNAEVWAHFARYQAFSLAEFDESISSLKKAARLRSKVSIVPNLNYLVVIMYDLDLSERLSSLAASVFFERLKDTGKPIPPTELLSWIPRKDNFFCTIANELIRDGSYEEAIKYARTSLSVRQTNSCGLEAEGRAYFFMGKYHDAISAYLKALKTQSDDKRFIYSQIAFSYQAIGQFSEAIEYFKKAKESGFPPQTAYYNIAASYGLARNKLAMLRYLKKAIEMDSELKGYARQDSSFHEYWTDPEFLLATQ